MVIILQCSESDSVHSTESERNEIVVEIQIIGTIQELYPRANPWIMLIADPDLKALARFCVGLCVLEV